MRLWTLLFYYRVLIAFRTGEDARAYTSLSSFARLDG
jgi:hypothetical protein